MELEENDIRNYNKLQDKVTKRVTSIFREEEAADILEQLSEGENSYLKYKRIENSAYDPRWIEEIEDCIYDLGLIIKNPRSVTQQVTDVVPVELARKTNGESVTHLATHSQYVKEVDDHGNVIPNKILNIGSDDFFKTYENRFIATLVRKLMLFIEKRCTFIAENTDVRESEVLLYKNKSVVDGREVEIETKIKVIGDIELPKDQANENEKFALRVEELRRYILYYYNSTFMKMMRTEKNVRNPILMTNIIRKNPLYNHCYRLYKFLEKYELLGVEFKTNDKYADLSKEEIDEINNAMMVNLLALRGKDAKKIKRSTVHVRRPKILSNIDDEVFTYGPWLKGPFEFVRIDETYIDSLALGKKKVPESLTKTERKYFKEELDVNRRAEFEAKKLRKILSKKKKEAAQAEKLFKNIIKERDDEIRKHREDIERAEINALMSDLEKARLQLAGQNIKKEDKKPDETPAVNNVVLEENNIEEINNINDLVTSETPYEDLDAINKIANEQALVINNLYEKDEQVKPKKKKRKKSSKKKAKTVAEAKKD